ncbi:MAG: hypothetical protein HYX61_02520 [Gammaproteobacteria bacterium]|jgi:glutamate decarboxylase|nr:hypothetical protein [Gammaproteobacteria bacterium]
MSSNKNPLEKILSLIPFPSRSAKNLGTFSTTHMMSNAVQIFNHYSAFNAVDSCAYPEFTHMEQECGKFFLELFHAKHHDDFRYFTTSGSSEALFMSLIFMKYYWKINNKNTQGKPNFVIGTNGHTAWHKATSYLDIELRQINVHPQHLYLDEKHILENIDNNTIGIGCTLGATTTLNFDEVQKINHTLEKYQTEKNSFIPIHVDAASGGLVAPFVNANIIWDFRLHHVVSINVSSHKFGMIYPSLGWLCVRSEISSEELQHESHYLGKSIKRYPIQFSHSGSHLATQYYYVKSLGFEGYQKAIKQLFVMQQLLLTELKKFEQIKIITPNETASLPGIVFTVESVKAQHHLAGLASYLAANGWHLPTFHLPRPADDTMAARIVIRQGFNESLMGELVNVLKDYFATQAE